MKVSRAMSSSCLGFGTCTMMMCGTNGGIDCAALSSTVNAARSTGSSILIGASMHTQCRQRFFPAPSAFTARRAAAPHWVVQREGGTNRIQIAPAGNRPARVHGASSHSSILLSPRCDRRSDEVFHVAQVQMVLRRQRYLIERVELHQAAALQLEPRPAA